MTTEAEICAHFAEAARKDGWEVYPEVNGWDMILVWGGEEPDDYKRTSYGNSLFENLKKGDQLAVEAKRRANAKALAQCIDRLGLNWKSRSKGSGPDFAAVLAPKISRDFKKIASYIGLATFNRDNYDPEEKYGYAGRRSRITVFDGFRLDYEKQLWLPPVKPEGAGGESSPSALTPWRVGALKICWILRNRGWVTTQDFDAVSINKGRWVNMKWIEREGSVKLVNESNGRAYNYAKYVLGPKSDTDNFPDAGWEAERDAIALEDPEGIPEELLEDTKESA